MLRIHFVYLFIDNLDSIASIRVLEQVIWLLCILPYALGIMQWAGQCCYINAICSDIHYRHIRQ